MTLLQIFISSRIIEEIEDKVNADLCATLFNLLENMVLKSVVLRILEFLLKLKNHETFLEMIFLPGGICLFPFFAKLSSRERS